MKEQFNGFDIKIIHIETEDIITTSTPGNWNGSDEDDDI